MTNESDDFREAMEETDLDHPDPWDPEPGEVLVATILEYDRAHTRYGEQYVANVRPEGERRPDRLAVWLSSTVLRDAFGREKPEPGERVGIKYHGTDEQKGYHRYTVRVDREGADAVPDFTDADPARDSATAPESPPATAENLSDAVREKRQEATEGDASPTGSSGPENAGDGIPF